MTDDEFLELMRRADPGRMVCDDRTESEVQAELERIVGTPARAGRRWAWLALPAAAALLLTLFVVQPWQGGGTPAHAATPALLQIAPIDADLNQVLGRARQQLVAEPDRPAERRSDSEGWYLETEVDEAERATSVVAPQVTLVEWNQDLSGRIRVTAGEAYLPGDGRHYPPADAAAPPAGTVLLDDRFPAGGMPLIFPQEPPAATEPMRSYLEAGGAVPAEGAMSYVSAVKSLLNEWTPSPRQQATLLQLIGGFDEVEVAGETVDRLGRPAIALHIASPGTPYWEYLLLIGRDSGRILALEDIYVGGIAGFDLPAPAVASYRAWR